MNKLAEKISPVMNEDELQQLISDHYLGEAQLLTTGAEENLLKLANCAARWTTRRRNAGRRSSATSCATRPWGPTTAMSAGAWSRSWPTSPPPCSFHRRRRKRLPLPTRHRGRRCWRPCIVFLKHVRPPRRCRSRQPPVCRRRSWPTTCRLAWHRWWNCWRHRRRSRHRCRRPWPRSPAGAAAGRAWGAEQCGGAACACAPCHDAGGARAG